MAKGKPGRLSARASYAPELGEEAIAILAALTDEQKLAVGHAIHLASVALRGEIAKAARWKASYMRRVGENLPRLEQVAAGLENFAADLEADIWRDHLPIGEPRG